MIPDDVLTLLSTTSDPKIIKIWFPTLIREIRELQKRVNPPVVYVDASLPSESEPCKTTDKPPAGSSS
jgi:hypothetical protein